MVAFNEVGQGFFTFEELDLQGALADVREEVNLLLEKGASMSWGREYAKVNARVEMLAAVMRNLQILIRRGQ